MMPLKYLYSLIKFHGSVRPYPADAVRVRMRNNTPILKSALLYLVVCAALSAGGTVQAQADLTAVCGVVDALRYPLDDLVETTLARGYDDFARFRASFGGNHTGFDMGFNQHGDPVRAMARGRVTYSDIEGWDTEKGVVIVEHLFPDGSLIYSLYGHVEEANDITLPRVGDCVAMGDTVGAVGWPSRGAPHLHFEVRTFLPDDGGPGYVTTNPLREGWLHPLDFIHLWQFRLMPAFETYTTFQDTPTLPPVVQENGVVVMASGNVVQAVIPPAAVISRISTDGPVSGLVRLPDNRVVTYTENGQTAILTNGRFSALWTVNALPEAPVVLGEVIVFVTVGGGLEAYDPAGQRLWAAPPLAQRAARLALFRGSRDQVAVAVIESEGVLWRVVDAAGEIVHEATYQRAPLAAPLPGGGWMLLVDGALWRIANGEALEVAAVNEATSAAARLTVDTVGNSYAYLGDSSNTLISWSPAGTLRWRIERAISGVLPPLLRTDNGCLLYLLDSDGRLNLFEASSGERAGQVTFYAGGNQSRRPNARLLEVDNGGHVRVHAGFLTTIILDGAALGADVIDTCLLG